MDIFTGTISNIQKHTTRSNRLQVVFDLTVEGGQVHQTSAWNELAEAIDAKGNGASVKIRGHLAPYDSKWHKAGTLLVDAVDPKTKDDFAAYEDRDLKAGEIFTIADAPYEHDKVAIAIVIEPLSAEDIRAAFRAEMDGTATEWYVYLERQGKIQILPFKEISYRGDHFTGPDLSLYDSSTDVDIDEMKAA
jgi:hypothetical protein